MKRITCLAIIYLLALLIGTEELGHTECQLPLPCSQGYTTTLESDAAFEISTDGVGPAVRFEAQGTGPALEVKNSGGGTDFSGPAGVFFIWNQNNQGVAVRGYTKGKGPAARFEFEQEIPPSVQPTLDRSRAVLEAATNGDGMAAEFEISNVHNSKTVLHAYTKGMGPAGKFEIHQSQSTSPALEVRSNGRGWTAVFDGGKWFKTAAKGVYIRTAFGRPGLLVHGGTKSALVPTSKGDRTLYSEEATEVWFSDYGFGKLTKGTARITIDPLYAETVDLTKPYHVFIQAYGDAQLYVAKRSGVSFEVLVHQGNPNVDFSYRIVAKRRGYDKARLEHVPGIDKDINKITK